MKRIALDRRRIAARRFNDEMAIVDLPGRTVHRLNATASHLWGVLTRGGGYDELVRDLCETYEVEADAARRDVDAFLATLVEAGLAKVEEAPDGDVASKTASEGGQDE